jgi:hypothetical protein
MDVSEMSGGLGNKLAARGAGTQAMMPKAMTYGEQVDEQLKNAEQRVAELKRIQELLKANPDFEELLTLVGRTGSGRY